MLVLKKEFVKKIVAHSLREYPNEACGILAGTKPAVAEIFEMTNTQRCPNAYFMDAQEQFKVMKEIRRRNLEMVGIYHSHPASQAYPSEHDVELFFYSEVACLIVSLKNKDNPQIRSFSIIEGEISEEEVQIE